MAPDETGTVTAPHAGAIIVVVDGCMGCVVGSPDTVVITGGDYIRLAPRDRWPLPDLDARALLKTQRPAPPRDWLRHKDHPRNPRETRKMMRHAR